jgi:hypothetical protein
MIANMEVVPWVDEFIKQRPDFCFCVEKNQVRLINYYDLIEMMK